MRKAALVLIALAGCSQQDNLILGGIGASDQTPQIVFDNIGSSIAGKAMLSDRNGNPIAPVTAVILSDRGGLCDKLKLHPDYFRNPVEGFIAMILFMPVDRVGTFLPGRQGDEGTGSEIIGVNGPGAPVLPFVAADLVGFITLAPDDNPSGQFNLLYGADPALDSPTSFPFQGKYKAEPCPNLAGALLP
jgi:hypothetical protein